MKIYCVRWRQNGKLKQREFTPKQYGTEALALVQAKECAARLRRNQMEYELFSAWEENYALSVLKTKVHWLGRSFPLWMALTFVCCLVGGIYLGVKA